LTGATNIQIYFKLPNLTVNTVAGTIYLQGETNSGKDGLIYYITQAGNLSIPGQYKVQISYDMNGGTIYTSKSTFVVDSDISLG